MGCNNFQNTRNNEENKDTSCGNKSGIDDKET